MGEHPNATPDLSPVANDVCPSDCGRQLVFMLKMLAATYRRDIWLDPPLYGATRIIAPRFGEGLGAELLSSFAVIPIIARQKRSIGINLIRRC
jgi:hypothetical protein